MSQMELRNELKTIVAEIIEIDDFNDDDNFVAILGADSMLALEIVARTASASPRIASHRCERSMRSWTSLPISCSQ